MQFGTSRSAWVLDLVPPGRKGILALETRSTQPAVRMLWRAAEIQGIAWTQTRMRQPARRGRVKSLQCRYGAYGAFAAISPLLPYSDEFWIDLARTKNPVTHSSDRVSVTCMV